MITNQGSQFCSGFFHKYRKDFDMIYFKNEKIKIARHFAENVTKMTLTNEMTGVVKELTVEDTSTDSHFYEIDFTDVTLSNGNYVYRMGEEVGLMQVGEYTSSTTQYKDKKDSIVYGR